MLPQTHVLPELGCHGEWWYSHREMGGCGSHGIEHGAGPQRMSGLILQSHPGPQGGG